MGYLSDLGNFTDADNGPGDATVCDRDIVNTGINVPTKFPRRAQTQVVLCLSGHVLDTEMR